MEAGAIAHALGCEVRGRHHHAPGRGVSPAHLRRVPRRRRERLPLDHRKRITISSTSSTSSPDTRSTPSSACISTAARCTGWARATDTWCATASASAAWRTTRNHSGTQAASSTTSAAPGTPASSRQSALRRPDRATSGGPELSPQATPSVIADLTANDPELGRQRRRSTYA
jgi:hypothetical protein